ncbi:MAG: helix-turn-helix transcriptional regulator [Verrucomicrobiia bacterium]
MPAARGEKLTDDYQPLGERQGEPLPAFSIGPEMGRKPHSRRDRYGAWLHHLRTEKGLTQQQLADEIGVPQNTLAYWERTGKLPGREVIIRLSRLFNVSVQHLLRVDR